MPIRIEFQGEGATSDGATYQVQVNNVDVSTDSDNSRANLRAGTNTIEIVVTSDQSQQIKTYTINITRETPNTPPVANAGSAQTVNEGDSVTLDGSLSTDNIAIESYGWSSEIATLTLTNADAEVASFIAPEVDVAGLEIILTLTVTDTAGLTDSATVLITINNVVVPETAPIANAGINQSVNEGAAVRLDGTGSTDNEPITLYGWSSSIATLTLTGADTNTAGFTAPEVEEAGLDIILTLTVTDTAGVADSATVLVRVNNVPEVPITFADGIDDQFYTVDEAISILLPQATGGSGNLVYTLENLPDGLTFNRNTRSLSGTRDTVADESVIYTVTDNNATETLTFRITVFEERLSSSTDTIVQVIPSNEVVVVDSVQIQTTEAFTHFTIAQYALPNNPDSTQDPILEDSIETVTGNNLEFEGEAINFLSIFEISAQVTNSEDTRISFTYDPNNLPDGVSAENLRILHFTANNEWIELDTTITVNNVNEHVITGMTDSFSPFALVYSTKVVRQEEADLQSAAVAHLVEVITERTVSAITSRMKKARDYRSSDEGLVANLNGTKMHVTKANIAQLVENDTPELSVLDFLCGFSTMKDGADVSCDPNWKDMLLKSSFAYTDSNSDTGSSLALWGKADVGGFSAKVKDNASYDGEYSAIHLGADYKNNNILQGVMVSIIDSEIDYKLENNTSLLDVDSTNISPYIQWQRENGINLWAMFSVGSGDVKLSGNKQGESDLKTNALALGIDSVLRKGSADVALLTFKSNFSYSNAEVDANGGYSSY